MVSARLGVGDVLAGRVEQGTVKPEVFVDAEEFHVDTLYDVLSSVILKIKGDGDLRTGRVEQGIVKPGEEAIFLPTHTHRKFFTVETHHQLGGHSFGEELERRAQVWWTLVVVPGR